MAAEGYRASLPEKVWNIVCRAKQHQTCPRIPVDLLLQYTGKPCHHFKNKHPTTPTKENTLKYPFSLTDRSIKIIGRDFTARVVPSLIVLDCGFWNAIHRLETMRGWTENNWLEKQQRQPFGQMFCFNGEQWWCALPNGKAPKDSEETWQNFTAWRKGLHAIYKSMNTVYYIMRAESAKHVLEIMLEIGKKGDDSTEEE